MSICNKHVTENLRGTIVTKLSESQYNNALKTFLSLPQDTLTVDIKAHIYQSDESLFF